MLIKISEIYPAVPGFLDLNRVFGDAGGSRLMIRAPDISSFKAKLVRQFCDRGMG
jgi:hypothetical protein